MTYFSVDDFNLRQNPDFCQGFKNARRKIGICSTDGTSATAHISSVCSKISKSISNTQILASRSISLHGLRATDIPRELARHRNLSARSAIQTLSPRHSWQHRKEHTGRRQRISRLAYFSGFCAESNPDRQNTLRQRPLCGRVGSNRLRTRHHDHRSVSERLSMGALSTSQSRRQDAYATRPARQYSDLH